MKKEGKSQKEKVKSMEPLTRPLNFNRRDSDTKLLPFDFLPLTF